MAEQTDPTQRPGMDLWLAAAMVFFLGVGAYATYTFTAPKKNVSSHRVLASSEPFEGTSFDTPAMAAIPVQPADGSKGGQDGTVDAAENGNVKPEKSGEQSYKPLSFELLAGFFYEDPNTSTEGVLPIGPQIQANIIPDSILKLAGSAVSVKGFMVPTKTEDGSVMGFLLLKDQSYCCWGQTPRMNDYIYVHMVKGSTADFYPDVPVTVYGTLDVGEEKQNGIVLSIYRMEAERIEGPLDL